MLLDHSDDMEAVGDDLGVGEVFADKGAVGTAQVHADDADVFLSLERVEVGVEDLRVAALDDVEDAMGAQVAEGGGELGCASMAGSFALDGVLVDTQHRRADPVGAFSGFACGVFVIEAFDRGRPDAFALGEDASWDAVAVTLVDVLPVGLGGVPVGFDAGERWDEGLAAAAALVATGVDLQVDVATEAVEVTHSPEIWPLAVDLQSPGLATLLRGSLRSTARAGWPPPRQKAQMQHGMMPMLLDSIDPIPGDPDFVQLQ